MLLSRNGRTGGDDEGNSRHRNLVTSVEKERRQRKEAYNRSNQEFDPLPIEKPIGPTAHYESITGLPQATSTTLNFLLRMEEAMDQFEMELSGTGDQLIRDLPSPPTKHIVPPGSSQHYDYLQMSPEQSGLPHPSLSPQYDPSAYHRPPGNRRPQSAPPLTRSPARGHTSHDGYRIPTSEELDDQLKADIHLLQSKVKPRTRQPLPTRGRSPYSSPPSSPGVEDDLLSQELLDSVKNDDFLIAGAKSPSHYTRPVSGNAFSGNAAEADTRLQPMSRSRSGPISDGKTVKIHQKVTKILLPSYMDDRFTLPENESRVWQEDVHDRFEKKPIMSIEEKEEEERKRATRAVTSEVQPSLTQAARQVQRGAIRRSASALNQKSMSPSTSYRRGITASTAGRTPVDPLNQRGSSVTNSRGARGRGDSGIPKGGQSRIQMGVSGGIPDEGSRGSPREGPSGIPGRGPSGIPRGGLSGISRIGHNETLRGSPSGIPKGAPSGIHKGGPRGIIGSSDEGSSTRKRRNGRPTRGPDPTRSALESIDKSQDVFSSEAQQQLEPRLESDSRSDKLNVIMHQKLTKIIIPQPGESKFQKRVSQKSPSATRSATRSLTQAANSPSSDPSFSTLETRQQVGPRSPLVPRSPEQNVMVHQKTTKILIPKHGVDRLKTPTDQHHPTTPRNVVHSRNLDVRSPLSNPHSQNDRGYLVKSEPRQPLQSRAQAGSRSQEQNVIMHQKFTKILVPENADDELQTQFSTATREAAPSQTQARRPQSSRVTALEERSHSGIPLPRPPSAANEINHGFARLRKKLDRLQILTDKKVKGEV